MTGDRIARGSRGGPGEPGRSFVDFPLRRRLLLSQLPLTVSALLATLAVLLVEPRIAVTSPHLLGGLAGILALTVAAGAVPWDRFPTIVYWILPLSDLVAIAPFWSAARYALDGMSMLSAFPMVWLAWSGIRPVLALTLGFLGSAVVSWWPYVFRDPPDIESQVLADPTRPMMVPFLVLAIGIAASVLTRSMDRRKHELTKALENEGSQHRMLRTVVETAEVGILVVNRDGHDVLMNQTQRRTHLVGLPPGMEDGGEQDLLLVGADGSTPIPAEERPVRRALRGETYQGELVSSGLPGSRRHYSVAASPMREEDGTFDGTVVVFQDVTDLVEAVAARERFVAEISHELRTPLTSIIGNLDLARDEEPDPPLRNYLATALRNAERLQTLVTGLLDAHSTATSIAVRDVELVQLVRHGLDSASAPARSAGVTLAADLPERLELRADPVRLSQVLDNLLSNAVKYTPRDGRVQVSLRPAPDTEGWALLTVQDTGIGMSEDEIAQLFTSFYRTEQVRRAAIPGTGLGLAITQSLVRAHGGEIEVTSTPGEGSTFTVRLPVDGPQQS